MRKTLSVSLLLLLASISTLSIIPVAKAHTITVDGDPTDWIGTAPPTNTWALSEGEWIWTDEVGDDTGNGSYTYPTATIIVDGVNRSAFTGGDADLTEFRITWDADNVYFLLTFDNITDNKWVAGDQAETTAVAICIDIDNVELSGKEEANDDLDGVRTEILLPPEAYWEYLIEIALADVVLWWYDGLYTVEAYRDFPLNVSTTVYETIEFAVPIDPLGETGLPDPEGQTWRLSVFVGLQDYEHFREIASAEVAATNSWAAGGGEGLGGAEDTGPDPDAFDAAFFANKTAQETALNGFTETEYAAISAYGQIPEFPLPFAFALIAIVVLVASFKLRKKLYP